MQSDMPSLAISTDGGRSMEKMPFDDERGHENSGTSPQTPSAENSRRPSSDDRPNHYQRDEKFHASLKKAASFRRRLDRERETCASTERIQEAAIARALNAAAVEFQISGLGQTDDSFFDAAIQLAAVGSSQPLSKPAEPKALDTVVSDDWSLPEMIGALVSRSRSAIRHQRKEIICLRLAVRELMHELLKVGSDAQLMAVETSGTIGSHETDNDCFSTPSKDWDHGRASHELRSISTPSTANTTPASALSERVTPQSKDSSSPPYSSHAPNRHILARGARINRSFSGDDQVICVLNDVQRSLDPKMQDTEHHQGADVAAVSPADQKHSRILESQAHQQSPKMSAVKSQVAKTSPAAQKPDRSRNTNAVSTGHSRVAYDKPHDSENNNDLDEDMEPESPLRAEGMEKSHVGHIVESILDAIIESSLGKTGEESTMSTLMFPALQPKPDVDNDQNSVLYVGKNPVTNTADPLKAFGGLFERSLGNTGVPNGTVKVHSDALAHLMHMESRTIEEVSSASAPRGEGKETHIDEGSATILASVSNEQYDLTASPIAKTPNTEHYDSSDDNEDDDDDDDDQGKRRMVVLISGTPVDRLQETNQERAMAILNSNGIEADFVDGSASDMKEIRDSLFGVSGIAGNFPQFFLVDDDGMTEFFGDFQDVEELNDAGELKPTFSRLSTTTTYANDDQLQGGSQEEKKDDHAAQAINTSKKGPRMAFIEDEFYSPEEAAAMMLVEGENSSSMNRLPRHTNADSTGRLSMIQEDVSVNGTHYSNRSSILEADTSDVDSSYGQSFEQYGDRSHLRWI